MPTWLYIAAANYANATTTYELAWEHGIVWRSFYRNAQPQAAINRVRDLHSGEVLYLGYRTNGGITLLGRMRIGMPDNPLQESPVFGAVPANLLPEFQQHRYGVDPILGQMVGIFVEEVQPWQGQVPNPGRDAIHENPPGLPNEPQDGGVMFFPRGPNNPEDGGALAVPRRPAPLPAGPSVAIPQTVSTLSDAVKGRRTYAGIDVSGSDLDICYVTFDGGRIDEVAFEHVNYAQSLPDVALVRPLVASGNLAQVAHMTFPAVATNAGQIRACLGKRQLAGVFIDSPSGFSRNTRCHGRLCEKNHFTGGGVSFQSTPSVACNREHMANWAWLVYGMGAFVAANNGTLNEAAWTNALVMGIYPLLGESGHRVRECFPTATISVLRQAGLGGFVTALLQLPAGNDAERNAVIAYLQHGVWAVKTRHPLYDCADALVAALTSLGLEFGNLVIDEPLPAVPRGNWAAAPPDNHTQEGAITVVRIA